MTDDLVAFLRARLDEDEQAARAATPGPWAAEEVSSAGLLTDEDDADVFTTSTDVSYRNVATDREGFGACSKADAGHIARHDPARVLVEVEVKRRIVDGYGEDDCVRLLALPYDGHPDYRDEWTLRTTS